jgi:hypothetical protein
MKHSTEGKMRYYKFEEADSLKQTFSSWIGKLAHTGGGKVDILENISIRPKESRSLSKSATEAYVVQFEFKNSGNVNAFEFLKNNGLSPVLSGK